jgi:hypothetical protein
MNTMYLSFLQLEIQMTTTPVMENHQEYEEMRDWGREDLSCYSQFLAGLLSSEEIQRENPVYSL